MLTKKNLNTVLTDIPAVLSSLGVEVERMVLFGSYAKGNVGPYSDVDIALWSPQFTGYGLKDLNVFQPLLRKYPMLDIKTFPSGTTYQDDPFIGEIENTGLEINLHEEEIGIK
jgi:predicted nucleotidyltransferase